MEEYQPLVELTPENVVTNIYYTNVSGPTFELIPPTNEPISDIKPFTLEEIANMNFYEENLKLLKKHIYPNILFSYKSVAINEPAIGFTYDESLKAFIPPKPDETYILNTTTFEWKPNPNLKYDIHGNGKLYQYDVENDGWIPVSEE